MSEYPVRLKIWGKKSLEKGFGGRTFPQKGFPPIITYKIPVKAKLKVRFI